MTNNQKWENSAESKKGWHAWKCEVCIQNPSFLLPQTYPSSLVMWLFPFLTTRLLGRIPSNAYRLWHPSAYCTYTASSCLWIPSDVFSSSFLPSFLINIFQTLMVPLILLHPIKATEDSQQTHVKLQPPSDMFISYRRCSWRNKTAVS